MKNYTIISVRHTASGFMSRISLVASVDAKTAVAAYEEVLPEYTIIAVFEGRQENLC